MKVLKFDKEMVAHLFISTNIEYLLFARHWIILKGNGKSKKIEGIPLGGEVT